MTIQEITNEYRSKMDYLDMEILIAHSLGKTREFVLTHPEYEITSRQLSAIKKIIERRMQKEPIAHITGHKEFYGLDFTVNKYTLVPRPETEMIVDQVIQELSLKKEDSIDACIVDIGTGSGCIAISIAKKMTDDGLPMINYDFYASDISKDALKIAKKNAKDHGLDKKIRFLQGNLLSPLLRVNKPMKLKADELIVTANLPYLSRDIYNSTPTDVKKFEPKSALYSPENGLAHYRKLFEQLEKMHATHHLSLITCILEFSPEQKIPLAKLIKSILPKSKAVFQKDLANKWRTCKITL